VRTEQVLLVRGEEYLEHVLVGSRVGAGGMTAGLLLEDQGKDIYMLQCAHAYDDRVGKGQCVMIPYNIRFAWPFV
jgi:hypothetical protein